MDLTPWIVGAATALAVWLIPRIVRADICDGVRRRLAAADRGGAMRSDAAEARMTSAMTYYRRQAFEDLRAACRRLDGMPPDDPYRPAIEDRVIQCAFRLMAAVPAKRRTPSARAETQCR